MSFKDGLYYFIFILFIIFVYFFIFLFLFIYFFGKDLLNLLIFYRKFNNADKMIT